VLLGVISSAQAVITIEEAEERNGVASIKGKGAVPGAQITWDGAVVTAANNNNGAFSFLGVLPAECRGELSDGAETVLVDVLHCTPVSTGAPAPVEVTGQTTCYGASGVVIPCLDTGQDGDIQAGVPFPSPRFTDNGDSTVTDNLTNLIWLKNANCFPGFFGFGLQWEDQAGGQHALNAANTLASGSCGLTDGSAAGDWRLPNVKELQSLIDFGNVNPALPRGRPLPAGSAGNGVSP
jgi:hypothetical protein